MSVKKSKKIAFFGVLFITLVLGVLLSIMAEEKVLVTIDFQAGFQGEDVELHINNEVIDVSASLVSNKSIDHALSIEKEMTPGTYEFILTINKEKAFQQKLIIQRSVFLGFGIFTDGSPYLMITNKPFMYD